MYLALNQDNILSTGVPVDVDEAVFFSNNGNVPKLMVLCEKITCPEYIYDIDYWLC